MATPTTTNVDHSLRSWFSDFLPVGHGKASILQTAATAAPIAASKTASTATQPTEVVIGPVCGVKRREVLAH